MKKHYKLLIAVGVLAITGGVFQNCGSGFESINEAFLSSEGTLPIIAGSQKVNPFFCQDPNLPSTQPLRRLNRVQYDRTVQNLLGTSLHSQVHPLIESLYDDSLKSNVNDFGNAINDTQMTTYQAIAEAAYNSISANPTLAQALATSCITAAPTATSCRDQFIRSFGLKAFRRPLTESEIQHWATKVFSLGQSGPEGVALVAYGMMLSPHFLLRPELGTETSSEPQVFPLTPYEVASRLSYQLTDAPPDAQLLSSASQNALSTAEQLEPHVNRLIQSPRGREKVKSFFRFWLDPKRYSSTAYTSDFLGGVNVNQLNDEYARELDEFVEYMVYTKKATFQELITSQESFARSPAAEIYGHAPSSGGVPQQMAAVRKGLFMRGGVLTTEGNETHPIIRGVKVRVRLLCEDLGLPSGVMTNDPSFFSDQARKTSSTRERTAALTSSASCMACHASINPAGFAFENFDGLARYRLKEKAYALDGTLIAEHPIQTDSSGLYIGGPEPVSVRDGQDLIDEMAKGNRLPGCFIRQSHRFFNLKRELADDGCVLSEAYNRLLIQETEAPILESLKNALVHESVLKRRVY